MGGIFQRDHEKNHPPGHGREERKPGWPLLVGILFVCLLGSCATLPPSPGVPVDPDRLAQARYVEVTYISHRPPEIRYLETLPVKAPHPRGGRSCEPRGHVEQPWIRATWYWKTRHLLLQARARKRLLRSMRRLGLDQLNLEVTEPLGDLSVLVRELETRGIRVVALSGAPGDIDHPRRVEATITSVLHFNRDHARGFSGLQFDIEPYALPGFARHKRRDYLRYARLVREIRARIGGAIPWSMVVPFWFDQVPWKGQSLLTFVQRQADAVVIMAYRSRYPKVLALARPGLCEGQRLGKPVYLGIETAPLPDQDHFFLTRNDFRRELQSGRGQLDLARRITGADPLVYHYEVRGADLTFHAHPDRLRRLLGRSPAYTSFAGWILEGPVP